MKGLEPETHASVETWCEALIRSVDWEYKRIPRGLPDPLDPANWTGDIKAQRLAKPGRPDSWQVVERSEKTPKRKALLERSARAQLVHTLAHHELQAAELFAWSVLAFPSTPLAFRQGLVRLALEELGHLRGYVLQLERLGSSFGEYPVRDWFWSRVHQCETPEAFVGFVGLGLEGANLEHSARFAEWFREAGDLEGAAMLERVERDEIGHVAFAVHWFERLTREPLTFDGWQKRLPEPLSPALFRGKPFNTAARKKAGLSDTFLDQLKGQTPAHRPRP